MSTKRTRGFPVYKMTLTPLLKRYDYYALSPSNRNLNKYMDIPTESDFDLNGIYKNCSSPSFKSTPSFPPVLSNSKISTKMSKLSHSKNDSYDNKLNFLFCQKVHKQHKFKDGLNLNIP